jgi:hypothetical protein
VVEQCSRQSTTVEERVAMLEKELTKLKQFIQGARVAKG